MKQEVTQKLPVERSQARCSVIATLKLFDTKWKPGILTQLQDWGIEHLNGVTSIQDMLRLGLA